MENVFKEYAANHGFETNMTDIVVFCCSVQVEDALDDSYHPIEEEGSFRINRIPKYFYPLFRGIFCSVL